VSGPEDVRNIDLMFTQEKPIETPETAPITADVKKKTQFDGFTYNKDAL
jgi:hypothetical protein